MKSDTYNNDFDPAAELLAVEAELGLNETDDEVEKDAAGKADDDTKETEDNADGVDTEEVEKLAEKAKKNLDQILAELNGGKEVKESDADVEDDLGIGDGATDGTEAEPVNTDDEGDDEDDPDNLTDEELAELDKLLRGDDDTSVSDGEDDLGDIDGADLSDDDLAEITLTPDEELKADEMMQIAATTKLVNDELNAEERAAFVQNEADTAIREGFMTDADVNLIAEEAGLTTEGKYTSKQIIKLSAESKKKQLFALAVNVSAASHGDADWKKLKKVMLARKILRERLTKKYKSEAIKRCRVYFRRLQSSKSPVINKLADKVK